MLISRREAEKRKAATETWANDFSWEKVLQGPDNGQDMVYLELDCGSHSAEITPGFLAWRKDGVTVTGRREPQRELWELDCHYHMDEAARRLDRPFFEEMLARAEELQRRTGEPFGVVHRPDWYFPPEEGRVRHYEILETSSFWIPPEHPWFTETVERLGEGLQCLPYQRPFHKHNLKVGNYVGDGLDQIIGYETQAIAKHGYSLWTFAHNAIARKTIYRAQKKWAKQDKGVYAILTMTFSPEASEGRKTRYPVLEKGAANKIKKAFEGKTDAFFEELEEVQNGYRVRDDIDVTAKGDEPTCEALVIEQLYLLDRTYPPKVVAAYYDAVRGDDTLYIKGIDSKNNRRTSFFMRRKESAAGEFWKAGTEDGSRRMSFLAKLAPPYVVVLSRDDSLKEE